MALTSRRVSLPRTEADTAIRSRRAHEDDYQIVGDNMRLVEIELDPGETVITGETVIAEASGFGSAGSRMC